MSETNDDIAYYVAEEIVGHLELQYPAALKAVPKTARISLKNFSQSQVKMALISKDLSHQKEVEELNVEINRLKKAETDLDNQLKIQENEPSVKTDGYMAGLLNGMLLAKANFGHAYNPVSYKDSHVQDLQSKLTALEVRNERMRKLLSLAGVYAKLEEDLMWLEKRTSDRKARNVEGLDKV